LQLIIHARCLAVFIYLKTFSQLFRNFYVTAHVGCKPNCVRCNRRDKITIYSLNIRTSLHWQTKNGVI